MASEPGYKDEETLRKLYREKELSLAEVGDRFDVSASTIHYWIHKFDIPPRYSGTLEERFERYYEVDEETGCWVWQNNLDEWGYGSIAEGLKQRRAHRVAFELYRDEDLPEFSPDHQLNHTCHNPACVNPDHLYIGTAQENIDDAMEIDAWGESRRRGSEVGNSKLTEDEVVEIKERCLSGESQKDVAKDYDVSHTAVNKIMVGQQWKHVGPDVSGADTTPDVRYGESNNRSVLEPEDVREIRRLYNDEDMIYEEIADEMGVGRNTIGRIIRGETWGHV